MRRGMMPSEANGRNGDTLLVHMKPSELQTIHANARRRGLLGVTTNPKDGRPEAWAAETDSDAANGRDVADGGNRDFSTGQTSGDFSNQSGSAAAPTTDETSLFDKAKNVVGGILGLDKKGDLTARGTAGALLGGLGPPGIGTAAGVVAGMIGDKNVAQIENARANGSLSEADYAAIQAGGTGTIKGGGLMGEDVQVGLHGANENPDRAGAGGNEGAQGNGGEIPPPAAAQRAANYTGTRGLYLPSADEEGEYKYDPTSQRMRWITKER